MHLVDLVIVIVWVIFWAYWLFAARGVKSGRSGGWNRFIGLRVALLLLGLALAVWARLYIGRNWGAPMSHKDEPELVTTGPYRRIRHPIYTGLILAVLGTALATTLYGLIVAAVLGGFFVYSATREEAYLTEQFQDTYRAYKHSTKMLIPFVL
jgi:protein-S-isoprenylcysteine O-methyltransferase Ste14